MFFLESVVGPCFLGLMVDSAGKCVSEYMVVDLRYSGLCLWCLCPYPISSHAQTAGLRVLWVVLPPSPLGIRVPSQRNGQTSLYFGCKRHSVGLARPVVDPLVSRPKC